MGLFGKNTPEEVQEEEVQEQSAPARNPGTLLVIRLLAVGYLLWTCKRMLDDYLAGGEDAPELWLLIGTIVLFVAGAAWIGVTTLKQYKEMKAQQAAEAEALALLEADEDEETDEEAYEEIFDEEDPEE